jgi:hypothetical protein
MEVLVITEAPMIFNSGITEKYGDHVYIVDLPMNEVDDMGLNSNVLAVYSREIPIGPWINLSGVEVMGLATWNMRLTKTDTT